MMGCIFCAYSYYSTETGRCTPPEHKLENCVSYKATNFCLYCKGGYAPNQDGNCVKITNQNCVMLDFRDSSKCMVCSKGYLANKKGICNLKNKCSAQNCDYCTFDVDEEMCLRCKKGFIARGTKCLSERPDIKNCWSTFADQEECIICDFRYYMIQGRKCIKTDKYDGNPFDQISMDLLLKVNKLLPVEI